jgi:energy-coupling factor transporter ATP-binding protein EcfA2
MILSSNQRHQLVQWLAAVPEAEFNDLLFSLAPPPGTISSAPAPQIIRATELLAWAEGILGPGIPEVITLLRSSTERIAPQKLKQFNNIFPVQLSTEVTLDQTICPYQGLEAFTSETQKFFYGRQSTVNFLLKKLKEHNFVPIIGPSGCGKSSVVRAGLIPSLGQDWQILDPIKPNEEPLAALRAAMRSRFQRTSDINRVTQLLSQGELLPVLEMLPNTFKTGEKKALLVIDQFEEVFTVCPLEEERIRFIEYITAVQTLDSSPLAIVTTMRADFVEQWLHYGDLVQSIQNQAVWLGEIKGDDLVQAIEKPANELGFRLAPGLLELILEDVKAEKNCLPLLEFALTELWKKRNPQTQELPLKAYTDMQGLKGALNKRAEAVYKDDLTNDEERAWAKRICMELVRIGPDSKDTRRRLSRSTLLALGKNPNDKEIITTVIEVLVRGRLLLADNSSVSDLLDQIKASPPAESEGGFVDLAHEALMIGWERFADWRQLNRDRRRLIQRVKDAEEGWNKRGRKEGYLLQGGLLAEVRQTVGNSAR